MICPDCDGTTYDLSSIGSDEMYPPQCDRCKGRGEISMSPKTTMTRRFYATASAVEYNKLLGTMNEAVADGESKLRELNSKSNKLGEIYIVEVVKILKLEPKVEDSKPIEVIEVRR